MEVMGNRLVNVQGQTLPSSDSVSFTNFGLAGEGVGPRVCCQLQVCVRACVCVYVCVSECVCVLDCK